MLIFNNKKGPNKLLGPTPNFLNTETHIRELKH